MMVVLGEREEERGGGGGNEDVGNERISSKPWKYRFMQMMASFNFERMKYINYCID